MLGYDYEVIASVRESGGAIHVLVPKNLSSKCIKSPHFFKISIFYCYRNFFKTFNIMLRGVEKRDSFRAFIRVFQWESYLVVCGLLKRYMGMYMHILKSYFEPKKHI